MNKHTPQWYIANMGNDHQGLVVDEATGHNIAVAYDRKDTPMLAAAPAMYEALTSALNVLSTNADVTTRTLARQQIEAALAQAEGRG